METATPSRRQRDALIHAHMPLADTIAAAMAHRYGGLVERDDLIQVARLELVRAAARLNRQQAEPYLRRCIQGAIRHHLRDKVRLVRVSRRAHESGNHPFGHSSLDVTPKGSSSSLLEQLAAPEPEVVPGADLNLDALLDQLPASQAAALRLTLLEGLSLRQAAAQLGISTSSVHRAQRTALAQLRQQVRA
ncbi:sigma-70 family RNA polymerase sigma factor [Vulcanococcus limneticus]|uniref:sigma-70 family RNA polymerase sigma factor n=1 Tax=Vulcanococcus limneticus TaxID=2170428 RepID=UPI00398C078A